MMTSLNEIKLIDGYIFNNNPTEDTLLFDALLIINPQLSGQVVWQKKTHVIVQQYSRKKLKAELNLYIKNYSANRRTEISGRKFGAYLNKSTGRI